MRLLCLPCGLLCRCRLLRLECWRLLGCLRLRRGLPCGLCSLWRLLRLLRCCERLLWLCKSRCGGGSGRRCAST